MKKPTMKQVKQAIDNLIIHMSNIQQTVNSLDSALSAYIKFEKNEKKFNTWIKKEFDKAKKEAEEMEKVNDKSTKTTGTSNKGDSKSKGKV